MNITTKENGTQYNAINQAIIDFHINNNLTICSVDRNLTYKDNKYIDDITQEEVNKGYDLVRQYLYSITADPLFFKVQRGEATKQEWLDEVAKIKELYPNPEV